MSSRAMSRGAFHKIRHACKLFCMAALMVTCLTGVSSAAGIRLVSSVLTAGYDDSFTVDVVAEGIPTQGLGTVQFRLNASAPNTSVNSVSDLAQANAGEISIVTPLLIGPATSSRSGIGDFFWNARSVNGILVMDNETLQNGAARFSLSHTNGAVLSAGSGTIARFLVKAGSGVSADHLTLTLSDSALLNGDEVFPLDYATGADVQLRCKTKMPALLGLSYTDAVSALAVAHLSAGTVYEIDNASGSLALNVVLEQSIAAGTNMFCGTTINLAVNTPPQIRVANITEGSTYTANITPDIAIVDTNLRNSSATLNSQSYASGTPITRNGSYTLTIAADDTMGNAAILSLHFTLIKPNVPPIALTTGHLVPATIGTAYAQSLAVTAGYAPYTWSLTNGTLPAGLALNSATGVISGTPAVVGMYPVTLQVSDEDQYTSSSNLVMSVNDIALKWAKVYDAGPADVVAGIAVDEAGNAFVSAYSWNGTTNDYHTVKYDQAGNVLWTRVYDSGYDDHAAGIAVDAAGNIYVTGNSVNGSTNSYLTIKYDSAGDIIWTRNNECGPAGAAAGVAVDGNGNVFVVGTLCNTAGCDIAAVGYDPSGEVVWSHNYDSGSDDRAAGVAVDAAGNLYIAGYSLNNANSDYISIKFDSTGAMAWTRTYDSGLDDRASGIAIDASGNVFVAGISSNGAATSYRTVKYDAAGNMLWAGNFDSGFTDSANGIVLDSAGNAYVAGSSSTGSNSDCQIVKLDPAGNVIWTQRYDSGNNEYTAGIAIDAIGGLTVAGYTSDASSNRAYLTVQYKKVGQGLTITSKTIPTILPNSPYSKTLIALGGNIPYTWSLISGALPDGMNLNAETGELSGTVTADANSTITVRVTDATGATAEQTYTVIAHDAPIITTDSLAPAVAGITYTRVLAASGGSGSYMSWSVASGLLPPGLSLTLNGNAGQISGIPTQTGSYLFTIRVMDSDGLTATRQLSIVVANVSITTPQLPSGKIGFSYIQTVTATGGTTPYTWSISSGSLPAGLNLDSATGAVVGIPSASGMHTVTIQATDANSASSTKEFLLTINDPIKAYQLGGSYIAAKKVIFRPQVGVTIYCTVDGTDPVTAPDHDCTGPVIISRSQALKFLAVDESGNSTALKTEQFVITGGGMSAWGNNSAGQLGDGTSGSNRLAPVQVNGLTDVVSAASGTAHTLALKKDGTVWAWGNNDYGQVGDGTSVVNRLSPVRVTGLADVIAVAAGTSHSFALKSDGTVWAWGNNDTGQLGLGSSGDSRLEPVQITGLSAVADIASGRLHAFALKKDGTVLAWGNNDSGQLGNAASGLNVLAPAPVDGLADVVAIAGGASHSIALKNDGSIWTWGNNDAGQLGNGVSGVNVLAPAPVNGLADVVAIAGGASHSIALKQDGTVLAWGNNDSGQLGNGASGINVLAPATVDGLADIVAIAGGTSYSMALKQDGTILAWGNNDSGQLGNGASGANVLAPAPVNGLINGDAVTSGNSSGYAITPALLTIATTTLQNGITGSAYSQNIIASGGLAPYSWSIASGSIAPGLTLNGDTGILSGTISAGGTFVFIVQVTDASSGTTTQQFTLNIYDPIAITSTSPLVNGSVGMPYSQTLTSTGGRSPYTWSLATGSTNSLPAGLTLSSSSGAISGTPSATGTSSFTVRVTDADFSTITKQLSITIGAAKPDLVMTSVSGPASANTESSITVTNTIKNQGLGSGNSSLYIGIYLSTDAAITTGDILIGGYWIWGPTPGASLTNNTAVTIPASVASGTYYIGAIADDVYNRIPEADETNNAITGSPITITKVYPDLIMTSVSGPTSANTEQAITVENTIKNQGLGSGNSSLYIGIYLSTDAAITTGDILIGGYWIWGPTPGASLTNNTAVTIPASVASGMYYIGAIADDVYNRIPEADETNNAITGSPITITKVYPDLIMTSVSGPTSANTEQAITVPNTVKNQGLGSGNTTQHYIGIYLSTDAAITTGDLLVGGWLKWGSAPGASVTNNTVVTIPASVASGTYYIGAIADVYNNIPESDETNNGAPGNQITVSGP